MFTFKDLKFEPEFMGVRAIMNFPNGYGISVINSAFSYGGDMGLYEVAVLKDEKVCSTPLIEHDDVAGWLTEEDVTEFMQKIQEL